MRYITNVKVFVFLTLILGFIYPALIFVVGQTFFHDKSNGSLVYVDERAVGSELIGQLFIQEKYFHPRPSANNYDALKSGGTNFSPTSKKLKERIDQLGSEGLEQEMLFTSGSGLDPHISLNSAVVQLDRIADARNLSQDQKQKMIQLMQAEAGSIFNSSVLGKPIVNVLKLNILLDRTFHKASHGN